jgi:hypothetical protein
MNRYRYTIKLRSGALLVFDCRRECRTISEAILFIEADNDHLALAGARLVKIEQVFPRGQKLAPLPASLKEEMQRPIGEPRK